MKTNKILSALSLALIICAVSSAYSASAGNSSIRTIPNSGIHHQVNIIVANDKNTCNVYVVEILDGKGQLVAPAEVYTPGVSKYDFYERGPAAGSRVAVLVLAPANSHFICETELFTTPVVLSGSFLPGQTYRYDLFPQAQPPRE